MVCIDCRSFFSLIATWCACLPLFFHYLQLGVPVYDFFSLIVMRCDCLPLFYHYLHISVPSATVFLLIVTRCACLAPLVTFQCELENSCSLTEYNPRWCDRIIRFQAMFALRNKSSMITHDVIERIAPSGNRCHLYMLFLPPTPSSSVV